VVAGGVAVLVTFHRSWLKEHQDHEVWCLEQLRSLPVEERDRLDTAFSITETTAEAFAAEAAIALSLDSESEWQRELIGRGIMAYHYSSTGCVMRQGFRRRDRLTEEFSRAVNLMICWAGLRWVSEHSDRSDQIDRHLERVARRLLKAYVQKRLPISLLSLDRIAAIVRRTIERTEFAHPTPRGRGRRRRGQQRSKDREVYRHEFWLDTKVLSEGFGFLGSLAEARDERDREGLLHYHSALLALFLGSMPKLETADEEVAGTPYEFDRWVLGLVARLIPQLAGACQGL